MKKFFCLLLALLMLAIMLPMVALAEDETGIGIPAGTDKPVEVWNDSGTSTGSYSSIQDAAANLNDKLCIAVVGNYELDENFEIPASVRLDVAENATLTVKEGVTLTVAANAKRLGVRKGGTIINNGTIMVCGNKDAGKFTLLFGATIDEALEGNPLSVPDGYFLDKNGSSYYAAENSKGVYEITFSDGTVLKTSDRGNVKGGVKQIKLLNNVAADKVWNIGSEAGESIVLDLNGYKLENNSGTALSVGTSMTIKNGSIYYTGEASNNKGALETSADVTIASDVTINGGSGFGIWTEGYGRTLTVYGEVTSNGSYAITGNGSKNGGRIADCNITIQNGAAVSAPNGIAIYHPELGTVTINGGNITGHTGVEMCAGKLVVNGGNIISTGDNFNATGSQNAILDGAAISIINRGYPGGIPTAEIKGGTIKAAGTDAFAVKAYDYTNNTVADWTDAPQHVSVTGGIFSGQKEAIVRLIPEGYVKNPYNDTDDIVKPSTITIIVPSEDDNTTATTPGTAPNPATGANDLVGVAAAAAVVALLGAAAVLRKK